MYECQALMTNQGSVLECQNRNKNDSIRTYVMITVIPKVVSYLKSLSSANS